VTQTASAGADEVGVVVAADRAHERAEAEPEREQVDRRLDRRRERRRLPVGGEVHDLADEDAGDRRALEPAGAALAGGEAASTSAALMAAPSVRGVSRV
jgi:hypothetical protein